MATAGSLEPSLRARRGRCVSSRAPLVRIGGRRRRGERLARRPQVRAAVQARGVWVAPGPVVPTDARGGGRARGMASPPGLARRPRPITTAQARAARGHRRRRA
jgi:hypothetical protein